MYATCSPVQEQIPAARALYKSKIIKMQFGKTQLASIPTNIWNDPDFKKLSAPAANAQFLLMRLMSAPEIDKIPGLISTSLEHLASCLGWSVEDTRRCWKEIEDIGWGFADWNAGFLWLPNAISKNPPKNLNTVKGWWRQFDALPKCGLLYQAWWRIGETLALRGEKWHEAFRFASDVIFAGAYSGDEFADIHACFGNRVIDFSKFLSKKPPPPQTTTPTGATSPRAEEERPPPSNSPPDGGPEPYAGNHGELFSPELAPPSTRQTSKQGGAPTDKDYEKVAKALDDADKIVWDGADRKYITRKKLKTNQKKCVDKILREGYSIDDIVKVILRKGEDAYRRPMYTDREGNEHSNCALVTLEHIARPGKMDYYLRQDELDEHKKPMNKKSGPITLEEHKKRAAETTKELKKSLSPKDLQRVMPTYTREEALRLLRTPMYP